MLKHLFFWGSKSAKFECTLSSLSGGGCSSCRLCLANWVYILLTSESGGWWDCGDCWDETRIQMSQILNASDWSEDLCCRFPFGFGRMGAIGWCRKAGKRCADDLDFWFFSARQNFTGIQTTVSFPQKTFVRCTRKWSSSTKFNPKKCPPKKLNLWGNFTKRILGSRWWELCETPFLNGIYPDAVNRRGMAWAQGL